MRNAPNVETQLTCGRKEVRASREVFPGSFDVGSHDTSCRHRPSSIVDGRPVKTVARERIPSTPCRNPFLDGQGSGVPRVVRLPRTAHRNAWRRTVAMWWPSPLVSLKRRGRGRRRNHGRVKCRARVVDGGGEKIPSFSTQQSRWRVSA